MTGQTKNFDELDVNIGVQGSQILQAVVAGQHFDRLIDRLLIPQFLLTIKQQKIFIDFARLRAKLEPQQLYALLLALRVLPNNPTINRLYKSWRTDIENREIYLAARAEVRQMIFAELRTAVKKNK